MPSLGADMEFGTVVAWLVKPGDTVRRGQVVAEVETEKGVFEVEMFADGIVDRLIVEKGSKAHVGDVLARLRAEPVLAQPITPVAPSPQPASLEHRGARASPLARRIAAAAGLDLSQVTGSGADGAITKADVERELSKEKPVEPLPPAATAPPRPREVAAERSRAMRQAVAAAVTRSKREIPHYYLATDIDVSHALAWLTELNQARLVDDRILPAALLLKSVAGALRTFPDLNAFWADGRLQVSSSIHLGVVISLRGGGLLAPAIHDADRQSLPELMRLLRDLVRRAREGGIRTSELANPTVSVTNLGEEGVESVFGVIYPPQVALVGFGRIVERPWAVDGMLDVRSVVTATLAADHRATDGNYGARFLGEVSRLLHNPASL